MSASAEPQTAARLRPPSTAPAAPSGAEQSASLHRLADDFGFSLASAAELMLDLADQPDAEVVGCVLAAAEHLEDALGTAGVIRRFML